MVRAIDIAAIAPTVGDTRSAAMVEAFGGADGVSAVPPKTDGRSSIFGMLPAIEPRMAAKLGVIPPCEFAQTTAPTSSADSSRTSTRGETSIAFIFAPKLVTR
jgi:hypothetical protein